MRAWLIVLCGFAVAAAGEVRSYVSSGTGFLVTSDGYVITNQHVVKHCERILLSGAFPERAAELIAQDASNDLALLKVSLMGGSPAQLRDPARALNKGDAMLLVGYPGQQGLAGRLSISRAEVSKPTGGGGDVRFVEISNVVQQGNSGGPMMDEAGNVAGVVSAFGETYTYFKSRPEEGTMSRYGIAISLPVLQAFMDSQRVGYRVSYSDGLLSPERIADDAAHYVVHVKCEYHAAAQ